MSTSGAVSLQEATVDCEAVTTRVTATDTGKPVELISFGLFQARQNSLDRLVCP